jgi:hypothetical protein
MLDGGYLIPANTKKGELIFSIFTMPDLILFGIGIFISVILLLITGADGTLNTIISLAPALVCSFLVLPLANYRNVRTFIASAFQFLMSQRIYRWKGWCLYEQTREIR